MATTFKKTIEEVVKFHVRKDGPVERHLAHVQTSPISSKQDPNVKTGRLEKLWQEVLAKKPRTKLSHGEFNKVYYRRLITAFKLRSDIFVLKNAYAMLSSASYCRSSCMQCKGCLSSKEKKANLTLQKIKMRELLDIYDVFTRFIHREEAVPSGHSKTSKPKLGQWLRIKGYSEFLEEFHIWRRDVLSISEKKKRNAKAKHYLRDPTIPTLKTSGYYCFLVAEDYEPMVEKDVDYPFTRAKSVRASKSTDRVFAEVAKDSVDKVAYWRAHTRSQRAVLLEAMSDKEKYDTLTFYRLNQPKVDLRAAHWRTELVARKYRARVEKERVKDVKVVERSFAAKKLCAMIDKTSEYVYRCSDCGITNTYRAEPNVFKCSTKGCKNFSRICSPIKGIHLSLGNKVSKAYFDKMTDQCFLPNTVDIPKIPGFDVVKRGDDYSYKKSDGSIFPMHCCEPLDVVDINKIYCDVYCSIPLGSVTSKVRIGNNPNYFKVDRSGLIDWYLCGKKLTFCKSKSFEYIGKLISGTPIFNTYGQLCGIVTSSRGFSYCIGRPYETTSMLISPADVHDVLTSISNSCHLKYTFIKHSTRAAADAAATAKALAEARIMTAVSAGRTESITREMTAVRELQTIADQKMAGVMNRALNINSVVRRKKNKKKVNQVVATTVTFLALFCLTHCQEFSPTKEINFLTQFYRDTIEDSDLGSSKIVTWLYNVKPRLASDYYNKFDDAWLPELKRVYNAWIAGDFDGVSKNIVYLVKFDTKQVRLIFESVMEKLRALVKADNLEMNVKSVKIILDKLSSGQDQLDRMLSNIQSGVNTVKNLVRSKNFDSESKDKIREIHNIVRREVLEQEDDLEWLKYFGKTKAQVVDCLIPITGNYSTVSPGLLEGKLKTNFTSGLPSFDYEHFSCKSKILYYKALVRCTKEGLFSEDFGALNSKCHNYAKCKHTLSQVVTLLIETFDSNIIEPKVTHKTCEIEREKLQNQFKDIKLKGHYSGVSIIPKIERQCQENPNWQSDGWLGGNSGSCVSGVDEKSWKVRGCVDLPHNGCTSKPASKCTIAWGNIIWHNGMLYSNSHKNESRTRCCSLHCHDIKSIYEVFTHQPMCSECIKPFTPIFWTEQCLLMLNKQPIASISITQSRTVFEIKNRESIVCNNAWHFGSCCGGKGPAAYISSDTFKDKHCVCSQRAPTFLELIIQKFLTLKAQFFSPIHFLSFMVIFFVFLTYRNIGIAVMLLYLSWLVVSVDGACSVENLVPIDSTSSFTGVSNNFAQVKVKPGQCISVGDATIEIVSVEVMTIYNFLRVIPYYIKPVCQLLDWGCPGGASDKVYEQQSDCFKKCVPGLRKQWKDSEFDWIGDKCFLNGRVATRLDLCFSYGSPNTFVELYTRVSGTPILNLRVKFHGVGFESVGEIETSNLGKDSPVTIIDVVSQPIFWPEMITFRLGKYLCSYHYVESSDTCNSGDIFKPMDIDVDCMNLIKKWNTEHGGYEMSFAKKDFETQLHNHFVDCGLNFEVTNNVTTLQYKQSVDWIEFKILGNNFHFAEAVPYCKDLTQWSIVTEPGLTYYHRRTQIKFKNNGSKCKIFVNLDSCVSTNGNLIVLDKQDNEHIIEYWCGANSTGTAHITVSGGRVETKQLKVLNNFLPHKNTIRNSFEKVMRAATVTDVKSWFSSLFSSFDFHGILGYCAKLFNIFAGFSWTQLILGLIFGYLAWANFLRGNIPFMILCIILVWLLCFTKIVLASTIHNHGVYGVANEFNRRFMYLLELCVNLEFDFSVLFGFIIKFLLSSALWYCEIIGKFSVLRLEQFLTKSTKLVILTYCFYLDFYLGLVVSFLINLNEILDKCSFLSGCENLGIGYNSFLVSWLTSDFTSDEEEHFNQVDDTFLYKDRLSCSDKLKTSYVKSVIHCGGTLDLVLPIESLKYEYSVIKFEGGVVCQIVQDFCANICVMSHCLSDDDPEEAALVSGNPGDFRKFKIPSKFRLLEKKGFSGSPRDLNGDVEYLSRIEDGNAIYCEPKFRYINWKYESDVKCDIYGDQLISIPKKEMAYDCIYTTPKVLLTSSSGVLGFYFRVNGVILHHNMTRDPIPYLSLDKKVIDLPAIDKCKNLELSEDDFVTHNCEDVSILSCYTKEEDPAGFIYEKTEKGLISDICWPIHVCKPLGVCVANDLNMPTRDSKLYTIASSNQYVYVWDKLNPKLSKKLTRVSIIGFINWPSTKPSYSVLPIRVQRSKVFQYDGNLVSGSLIYARKSCFFGGYFPISCVTKSFDYCGKQYYVISTPADEYKIIPMTKQQVTVDTKWNAAAVNENITIEYHDVVQVSTKYFLEFYNLSRHCVHRMCQDFSLFPHDMVDHSPDFEDAIEYAWSDIFNKLKEMKLDEYFLYAPQSEQNLVVGACGYGAILLIESYQKKLTELGCLERKTLIGTILRIKEAINNNNIRACSNSLICLEQIPVNPVVKSPNLPVEGSVLVKCRYLITDMNYPKDWSAANVHITVTDKDDDTSTCIDTNLTTHTVKRSDFLTTFRSSLHDMVARGERYITITIQCSHSEDLPPLDDCLEFPLFIALTFFVHVRYSRVPSTAQTGSDEASSLLNSNWRHAYSSCKGLSMTEDHSRFIKAWSSTPSVVGWQNRAITVKIGTIVSTFDQVGIWHTGEMLVGMLSCCVKRGSFFFYEGSLVTNWHVTKGCSIFITYAGRTYEFDKPVFSSPALDICMYGKKLIFKETVQGEVVTAFNPTANFGLHYSVLDTSATLQSRGLNSFLKLVPLHIDDDGVSTVAKCDFYRGMSGSPIVNIYGEPVGIFGLGLLNTVGTPTASVDTVTNYSGVGEMKIDGISFFTMCAKNFVTSTEKFSYCNAPTGSGKTTKLPPLIIKEHIRIHNRGCRVLILQPNVSSVVNCTKYMDSISKNLGLSDCKIGYSIGVLNADISNYEGGDRNSNNEIMIKTYGKNFETWDQMAHYDYVLLDEVHVNKDANVVATCVKLESDSRFHKGRFLYLSATHLSTSNGYDIAEGETLSATPKTITSVSFVACDDKESTVISETIVISRKTISCLQSSAIRIDNRYLNSGIVLFFCATRKECEKGQAFGTRLGVKSWAYHGASSASVLKEVSEHLGNGWVFATDIIQQSVTIPNLKTVVDFMHECKPVVVLMKDPVLYYSSEIRMRIIDVPTQVQRKGRVGRTQDGVYISGYVPVPARVIEDFVIPEVVLKLLETSTLLSSVKSSVADLASKIKSYSWLHFNEIEMILEGVKSQPRSFNAMERLSLTSHKDLDRVKWYVRPFLTQEEILYYKRSAHNKKMFGENFDDFFKKYKDLVSIVSIDEAKNLSTKHGMFSFKEPFDNEENPLEFDTSDALASEQVPDLEAEALEDQNLAVVAFSIAGCACVYGLFERLVDTKSSRQVTHVSAIFKNKVKHTARYLAKNNDYVKPAATRLESLQLIDDIRLWVTRNSGKLWRRVFKKTNAVEQNEVLPIVLDWLNWLEIKISSLVGLDVDVMSIFSGLMCGSLLGSMYRSLEEGVGRPMAILVAASVSGLVAYFAELPTLLVFLGASFVSQLVRAIVSTCTTRFGSGNHAGTAWSSVLSLVTGSLLGTAFRRNMIKTQTMVATETVNNLTLSSKSCVGTVGLPILLVKHFYTMLKMGSTEAILVSGVSIGSVLLEANWLVVGYAAVYGTLIFALECAALWAFDKYVTRDYSAPDGGEHLRNKKRMLSELVGHLLNASALVVYPHSLISIVIGMFSATLRGMSISAASKRAWETYAGVSPLIAMVTEVLVALQGDKTQQSGCVLQSISSILDTLKDGGSKCIVFFKNCWASLMKLLKMGINCVVEGASNIFSTIFGKCLRSNAVGRALLGPEVLAEEPTIVYTCSSEVNEYLTRKIGTTGLTSVEKYWMLLNPGSLAVYGSTNVLVEEIKKLRKGPARGYLLTSDAPLSFFKVTASEISKLANCIVGSCDCEGGVLKSTISNGLASVNVKFSNSFNADKVTAVIVLETISVLIWVIEVEVIDGNTVVRVIEFNTPEKLGKISLTLLKGIVGLDFETASPIDAESLSNWYKINIGPIPASRGFRYTIDNFKNSVGNLAISAASAFNIIESKVSVYTKPPYIFDTKIFLSRGFNEEQYSHARYWAGPYSVYYFHGETFKEKSYFDTKWNFPYGFEAKWLHNEYTSYNETGFKPVVRGLEVKPDHPFNTPIILTKYQGLNKYLISLFALNNNITVTLIYKTATCYSVYTTVDGADSCSKCNLKIMIDNKSYYYFFENHDHNVQLDLIDFDRCSNLIAEMYDRSSKRSIDDVVHLIPKQQYRGSQTGRLPELRACYSELPSKVLFGVSIEQVVEMNSTVLDSILGFFGLVDNPCSTPTMNMVSRLSYLLTPEQVVDDDDFQDFDEVPFEGSVVGFLQPTSGLLHNWPAYDPVDVTPISPHEVMASYNMITCLLKSDQSKKFVQWYGRFELPASVTSKGDTLVVARSRGFYKMQQLHEAWPQFFDYSNVIVDLACGAGGFQEFLATKYHNRAAKVCYVSTLVKDNHALPHISNLSCGNFKTYSLIHPIMGNGNLRNKKIVHCLLNNITKNHKVDLVMFDVGDFKKHSSSAYNWWDGGSYSIVDCIVDTVSTLRKGGRLLLRWTGYFAGGDLLLYKILRSFKEIRVLKLGTSSFFTPDFYLFCSGYGNSNYSQRAISSLYSHIGDLLMQSFNKAKMIWYNYSSYKPLSRNDWAQPIGGTYSYSIINDHLNRPPGLSFNFKFGKVNKTVCWEPNWDVRLRQFEIRLNQLYSPENTKRLRIIHGSSGKFKNLYEVGFINRKVKVGREKHTFNGLLNDVVWAGFKIDKNSSTIAMTQTLEAQKEASFKKRLDIKAPVLSPHIINEIREICQLLLTDYGKSLIGTMSFMSKERVLIMLNKQGATSIFSKTMNLGKFIEANPNWYDLSLKYCVQPWMEGLSSHCFFNVMHKNEPKKKKNASDGKITLKKGLKRHYDVDELRNELEDACLLPHRYIQYADEISRIAHYIVLGELIEASSKLKLYKGTINGVPPFLAGNVMRSVWDLHLPRKERVFKGNKSRHGIDFDDNIKLGTQDPSDPVCAVLGDYSGFDGTISLGERVVEADVVCQFYKKEFHVAINKCFSEMAFVICIDHEGKIWLRDGQRGSGELPTSFGNTLLAVANLVRVIARATGSTFQEICEKLGEVLYGQIDKGNFKILELMNYQIFADGDDLVIITNLSVAKAIVASSEKVLKEAGKVIRSGDSAGFKIVMNFYEIDFCSHSYEPVLIGPGANFIHKYSDIKKFSSHAAYKLRFLPTRPTSDILGKLRSTLKIETQYWKYDKMSERAEEITRSKVMSYLLLYPHMRYVRYTCLSALSFLNDGPMKFAEFNRRYPDNTMQHNTIVGALESVYGVSDFDSFSLRNYRADNNDAIKLEYNASLCHFKTKNDVTGVTTRLFEFMRIKQARYSSILSLDSKLNNRYKMFSETY